MDGIGILYHFTFGMAYFQVLCWFQGGQLLLDEDENQSNQTKVQ